jgi:hypothetical protein
MPTTFLAQVFAQQLSGLRMKQAYIQTVPLHRHTSSDPAWWRTVVSGSNFDTAVEVHDPLAILIEAEGLEW